MNDDRTPTCHYDRTLGRRVTRNHADTCPGDARCPAAGRGCQPCTEDHCTTCGRIHTTLAQPQTCPECQGKVDDDLVDIQGAYALLSTEALHAGHDGKLVAAAPIPGGDAQVLIGPTVRVIGVRFSRTMTDDHRRSDPLPPLAILAQWEDIYRAYLGHSPGRRATIGAAIKYLRDQLPYIAQRTDGPDFLAFTRQVRKIRAGLEQVLHDEREPERGVECFECGDRLVRRFRDVRRCRHRTAARRDLQSWISRRNTAQDWLRVIATYPELGGPRIDEVLAAAVPPASLMAAARRPCEPCSSAQGGIDDPRAGRSWECPGCRKEYSPGEYVTAVRRDLLGGSADGDGWTDIAVAAAAATTLIQVTVSEERLRKWAERGKVSSLCLWTPGRRWGQRLVYWPEVADEAAAALERAIVATEARRRRAEKAAAEAAEAKATA